MLPEFKSGNISVLAATRASMSGLIASQGARFDLCFSQHQARYPNVPKIEKQKHVKIESTNAQAT
jgi:hypothetical protein